MYSISSQGLVKSIIRRVLPLRQSAQGSLPRLHWMWCASCLLPRSPLPFLFLFFSFTSFTYKPHHPFQCTCPFQTFFCTHGAVPICHVCSFSDCSHSLSLSFLVHLTQHTSQITCMPLSDLSCFLGNVCPLSLDVSSFRLCCPIPFPSHISQSPQFPLTYGLYLLCTYPFVVLPSITVPMRPILLYVWYLSYFRVSFSPNSCHSPHTFLTYASPSWTRPSVIFLYCYRGSVHPFLSHLFIPHFLPSILSNSILSST